LGGRKQRGGEGSRGVRGRGQRKDGRCGWEERVQERDMSGKKEVQWGGEEVVGRAE